LPRPACTLILLFYTSHHCWDATRSTFPQVLTGTIILLISASHVACDDRCMPLWPGIDWNGISQTIYPRWLQTVVLPISASQVARITSMSHWCPAWNTSNSCLFFYWLL
jgi:hypothetical protein